MMNWPLLFMSCFLSVVPALAVAFSIPQVFSGHGAKLLFGIFGIMFGMIFVLWDIFCVMFSFGNDWFGFWMLILILCSLWSCVNGFVQMKTANPKKVLVSKWLVFVMTFLSSLYFFVWPWGWKEIYGFFDYLWPWGWEKVYELLT